ncbi:MAG: alpha/beta fold hydrolase [Anaerolineae bacterium]|nr:alpha/beta fold hydrolase [Anaerolineae bacterium]
MPQANGITPGPFFLSGGPVGVLLIHGFTGSPPEMRRLGDFLYGEGLTVSAPLLPGHGTTVADCNSVRWQQWTAHVEGALDDLRARCATVFVGGLSMGGVLALHLAAQHPDLAGALLYAPAIQLSNGWGRWIAPLLKHVRRTMPKDKDSWADPDARALGWSYREYPVAGAHQLFRLIAHVRRALPRVTVPLLIVTSQADRTVPPAVADLIARSVATQNITRLNLERSSHVVTLDADWQLVAEQSVAFIRAQLPADSEAET